MSPIFSSLQIGRFPSLTGSGPATSPPPLQFEVYKKNKKLGGGSRFPPNPRPCLLKKMFLKSLRWRLKGAARRKAFSSPWRRVLHMKIGKRSFFFSPNDREQDAALNDAYRDVRDELSPPAPHEVP